MENMGFYNDRKFCSYCEQYVPYLMSVENSYCAQCGQEVRLFSENDWKAFNEAMAERKPKGGRPSKKDRRDRESA
jgi:hypothetical protein